MSELLKTCTPWQQARAFFRRQSPWAVVIVLLLLAFPAFHLFESVATWLHSPALDKDSLQKAVDYETAGWVRPAVILSKTGAALFFFALALGTVWFTMHRILPVQPKWAKQSFTTEFLNGTPQWQFSVYLRCWFGLLGLFALCLLAAVLSQ